MQHHTTKEQLILRFAGRMDIIGAPVFLIGMLLKYRYISEGSILVILGLTLVSYSSVLKAMARNKQHTTLETILRKAFHFLISIGVLSILFAVQRWPGRSLLFLIFGAGSLLGIVIALSGGVRFHKLVDFNEKLKFGGALIFYLMAF